VVGKSDGVGGITSFPACGPSLLLRIELLRLVAEALALAVPAGFSPTTDIVSEMSEDSASRVLGCVATRPFMENLSPGDCSSSFSIKNGGNDLLFLLLLVGMLFGEWDTIFNGGW